MSTQVKSSETLDDGTAARVHHGSAYERNRERKTIKGLRGGFIYSLVSNAFVQLFVKVVLNS